MTVISMSAASLSGSQFGKGEFVKGWADHDVFDSS